MVQASQIHDQSGIIFVERVQNQRKNTHKSTNTRHNWDKSPSRLHFKQEIHICGHIIFLISVVVVFTITIQFLFCNTEKVSACSAKAGRF